MQYMLLIYTAPDGGPADGSAEQMAEMNAYLAFSEAAVQAGVMRAGAPLFGVDTSTSVRVRRGDRLVTDGPFAETKEVLMGYYVLECADLDAAVDWASKIPGAAHGTVEVRPVMEIPSA